MNNIKPHINVQHPTFWSTNKTYEEILTPNYSFNGDGNTGWYTTDNDEIGFIVNGKRVYDKEYPGVWVDNDKELTPEERYDRAMRGI